MITTLITLLAGVFGWGFFQWFKKNDAISKLNAANFNNLMKTNAQKVQENDAALAAEQAKREALNNQAIQEEKKDVTNQEALDFLNNSTPKQ